MTSTFTDPRDGNIYKTVEINGQTWLAENLKYTGVEYYVPKDEEYNIAEYGCLYDWRTARKACPEGWRLPTKDELEKLADLGNEVLRASSWDNGTNSMGFSALPAGSRDFFDRYDGFKSYARFWSSTEYDSFFAYALNVGRYSEYVINSNKTDGFSVRCIKD